MDVHPTAFGLVHQRLDDLAALVVVQGGSNVHVVDDLEEGEGHPAPDDHVRDFVQEVFNQHDLV